MEYNIINNENGTFTVNGIVRTKDSLIEELICYDIDIKNDITDDELIAYYERYLKSRNNTDEDDFDDDFDDDDFDNCLVMNKSGKIKEKEEKEDEEEKIEIIRIFCNDYNLKDYISSNDEDDESIANINDLNDVLSDNYTEEQLDKVWESYIEYYDGLESGYYSMYPNDYDSGIDYIDL